jgi:hypothetical protein
MRSENPKVPDFSLPAHRLGLEIRNLSQIWREFELP